MLCLLGLGLRADVLSILAESREWEIASRLPAIKNPPRQREGLRTGWRIRYAAARTTFPAWKPFGPFSRSNSTVSPSFSER